MGFEHIRFDTSDGVARLTLNKSPLNVLDIAMMREINAALEGLNDNSAVKVLVFQAAEGSKAFSAGVDVAEHTADMVEEMIETAVHRVPVLEKASMLTAWTGVRPLTVDDLPILGPVPPVDGFILSCGWGGTPRQPG